MKVRPAAAQASAKSGILRQEAIAGMDGIGVGFAGDAENLGDRQIGLDRTQALADLIGLVGLEPVEGELVFLGKDRDGADAELVGGAEDADRDLRSVGDENLGDGHAGLPLSALPYFRHCALAKAAFATARGGVSAGEIEQAAPKHASRPQTPKT